MDLGVLEREILDSVRDSLANAIKSKLEGYSSPLGKMVEESIKRHEAKVKDLIDEAIDGVMLDQDFRKSMVEQIHHKIARELTSSFGEGVFKKAVDSLKSDPTVRARCVLAIEKVVSEALKA